MFLGTIYVRAFITILVFLLSLAGAGKTMSATPPEPDSPELVEVGIWISGIHSLNFLDGSFGAEFLLFWISPDPDFRPFEVFQVLNGRHWTTRSISRRVLPNGSYHTIGYVSVTINHDWDLHDYPFDRQKLQIQIETPHTASKLRFVPNEQDSVVSEFAVVEGFQVVGLRLTEYIKVHETDFGIPKSGSKKYSRLAVEIELERESGRIVVAVLIGFIVANLIALLTYAIHASMLSVRATMVASAIFSAVGNMYFLHSELHPAVGSLLVDRFAVGTFSMILIALLNGIIVDRLVLRQNTILARRFNWTIFTVVLLGSAIFYSVAFHAAIR